jgi:hypothetical protein
MSIGKTNALFVTTLPYPLGVRQCRIAAEAASIGKTNALFVATLPYPPGVRQCRIAADADDRSPS